MIYIGCDVHKKNTAVAVLDGDSGEITQQFTVQTVQLRAELDKYLGECRIAIETSTAAMFVARELVSFGHDVYVVDAYKTKQFLGGLSRAKTDKMDALGLALLLGKGMLDHARVWVPSDQQLQARDLCRLRHSFVCDGTRTRNQIRKFLSRHGYDCPYSDLSGKNAQQWLVDLLEQLPPTLVICLRHLLDHLAHLVAKIQELTEEIEQVFQDDETVRLLKTIPGVGTTLATTIATEIGDISRFPAAGNLRSYSRLTPKVSNSGDQQHTGPLNQHGNRLLSWAFIQAAAHFVANKQLRETMTYQRYRRVCGNHGYNPARVNVARELATIVFAMLRDREPFDVTRLAAA